MKTTNDLLVLRSDCYRLDESHHLVLDDGVDAVPFVDLDSASTSWSRDFDERFPDGVPSLRYAEELAVERRLDLRPTGSRSIGDGLALDGRAADGSQAATSRRLGSDHASYLMPTDRLSTVDEHVERILEALEPLPPYDQPLLEALGLPVCEDIVAPMDLPSFDNSGDGRLRRLLRRRGLGLRGPPGAPAGGGGDGRRPDEASSRSRRAPRCRIMTGAPVPQGADAIVPVEWTDGGVAAVRITRAPELDQHVRHRGEDVQDR